MISPLAKDLDEIYFLIRDAIKTYLSGLRPITDFPYTYESLVRSWVGVGRFVLGLPGQGRVDSPDEFRAYLRGRVEEFSW